MSICVRPDYFQKTCYFAYGSDWRACLNLIYDWLATKYLMALCLKSLFGGKSCDYWNKSTKSSLYRFLRRKFKE